MAVNQEPQKLSLTTKLLLILFLVLSVCLKFYRVEYRSFFLDELYSLIGALEKNFSAFMQEWVCYDNSPPLYYLLLRGWLQLVPATEFGARCLSGILISIALFVFVKGIKKRIPGEAWFYLSLLLGCNYAFLFFAQEARAYGLLLLFTCCQLLYFINVLQIKNVQSNKFGLGFFVLFSVLSAYTHYSGTLFTGILFSALLYNFRKERVILKQILLGVLACIIAGLPWLPYFVFNMEVAKFEVDYSLLGLIKMYIPMLGFGNSGLGKAIALLFCSAICFLVYRKRNEIKVSTKFNATLIFLFLISCGIIVLFPFLTPMRTYRHYLVFIPLLLLCFSILIAKSEIVINKNALLCIGILILGVQASSHYKTGREEWRQAVNYMVEKNGDSHSKAIVIGEPWVKSAKEYIETEGEWMYIKIRRKAFYSYYLNQLEKGKNIDLIVIRPTSEQVENYIREELKSTSQIFILSYTGDLKYNRGGFKLGSGFHFSKQVFYGHEVYCVFR